MGEKKKCPRATRDPWPFSGRTKFLFPIRKRSDFPTIWQQWNPFVIIDTVKQGPCQ